MVLIKNAGVLIYAGLYSMYGILAYVFVNIAGIVFGDHVAHVVDHIPQPPGFMVVIYSRYEFVPVAEYPGFIIIYFAVVLIEDEVVIIAVTEIIKDRIGYAILAEALEVTLFAACEIVKLKIGSDGGIGRYVLHDALFVGDRVTLFICGKHIKAFEQKYAKQDADKPVVKSFQNDVVI